MYGDTGSALRREMTALLRLHRVQRRMGPSTERDEQVRLIRRYREGVLAWCATAMHVAMPMSFSNVPPRNGNPFEPTDTHGPARDLLLALELSRSRSSASPADLEQLTTECANDLLERWRQAARAAALAEHDTIGPAEGLTSLQACALVGDVAAITQALVVLDQRYKKTPGWELLAEGQRLGWTALAAALDAGTDERDHSIDNLGWQPHVRPMRGQVRQGILGVLQAEHNVLLGLATFPHSIHLRLVVDSQRVLSSRLAQLVGVTEPDDEVVWNERAETYREIQRHLRDIGGLLGRGERASAEAANVVARLKAVSAGTVLEPRVVTGFHMLADKIDARIADIVEVGLERGAFVERVRIPRLESGTGHLVQPVRSRYRPATLSEESPLVRVVRDRLRPAPSAPVSGPGVTRVELHAALTQRHVAGRPDGACNLSM